MPTRSLWSDTLPDDEVAIGGGHSPVAGTRDSVDVAIVGAGLTGLWTAWYLLQRDPGLRVVVLERETIGFGASGRNGGWCSALLPISLDKLAARHGEAAARRMMVAMHETVREVGRFVDRHGAPGMFHRGGTITVARNAPQQHRIREELDEHLRYGFNEADYRWLGPTEARAVMRATDVTGALESPHCAAVHPLRLTHAVARAVLAAGGEIREHTNVRAIHPGRLLTDHGELRSQVIVRATEGFTPQLEGERRTLLPIYSLMVATEPLPESVWAEIGLAGRPTFADGRHMIIYGQRTADDRFAFGGRGRRTTSDRRSNHSSTPTPTSAGCSKDLCVTCSRNWAMPPSPTIGAACWRPLATGRVRSASTGRPGWPAQGGTWATGSVPPICRAVRWRR